MDKKLEKKILEMVFDLEEYNHIKDDGENPDFLLTSQNGATIGIEVTELFFDESEARMKKNQDYLKDMIDNEKFMHKNDKEVFEVGEINIIDDEDRIKIKQQAVIRRAHNLKEYIEAFISRLKAKNDRHESYAIKAKQTSLIVFDHAHHLYSNEKNDFSKSFLNSEVCNELTSTPFREVYFVTVVEETRWVYFPLKMMVYLKELYSFGDFIEKKRHVLKIESPEEQLRLFAHLLIGLGRNLKITKTEKGRPQVVWSNYGISVDINNSITLRDYEHFSIQDLDDYYWSINPEMKNNLDSELRAEFLDFLGKGNFKTSLGNDIRIVFDYSTL